MESLQLEDRTLGFDKKNFVPGGLRQVNSPRVITSIKHRMAVQKAMDLIATRVQDPPTLGELASWAGLSRTYFSQVFKQVVGMRFQDYLIQVRIDKAKDLLEDINLTVKEIACVAGFRDPNHFSRSFRKKTGVTPTNWRVRKMEKSSCFFSKQNREKRDW